MSRKLRRLVAEDGGWIIIPIWWSRKPRSSDSSGSGGGCCGIVVLLIAGVVVWSLAQGVWRWLTSAWWHIPVVIVGVVLVLTMIAMVSSWSEDDNQE